MVLRINSVSTKFWTIRRRPLRNCPWIFLEIPQPSFTRGFLELAEEARNVYIENEQCFLVDEVSTTSDRNDEAGY